MRKALRILAWLAAAAGLLLALAAYLLYAPAPPEPALSAAAQRGTLNVGGRERSYLVFAPARRPAAPALVVAFHGSMGSPGAMRVASGYGFDRLADRHGFILAFPQGHAGNWIDCRRTADYEARRLNINDVGFFDALVARMRRDFQVDPARVYVVGLSSGGHFVFRLAFERPERIAAAAVFAANLPTPDNNVCAARGRPPPVMLVNGTADPLNPYEGGTVTLFGFGSRGTVLSARASAEYFARARGAAGPVTVRIGLSSRSDPTSVEGAEWRSESGAEVALLAVRGGGHVLPQPVYRPPRLLGRATRAIDGPAAAWDFFRGRRLGGRRAPAVR